MVTPYSQYGLDSAWPRVIPSSFIAAVPDESARDSYRAEGAVANAAGSSPKSSASVTSGKGLFYRIMSGGIAGVIGQTCVFPMYTVKTRMHTQPTRYRNALHCFRKIMQHDGWRGLYRGLPPAVLGVFPEKAIKLSMNDFLRSALARADGSLSLPMSVAAGGGAGFFQVVATNPMEMLMITMQTRALQGRKPKSMMRVIQNLGLPGLYRGTAATLARDVPFSMIFFSMRDYMEKAFADASGKTPISRVFIAGIVSGSIAAALSTPMDVIKTRLMAAGSDSSSSEKVGRTLRSSRGAVVAHASDASTKNIASCAAHIMRTEGVVGFFTGVIPRVMIISPLFGITLIFYEVQLRLGLTG